MATPFSTLDSTGRPFVRISVPMQLFEESLLNLANPTVTSSLLLKVCS